MFQIKTIKRFDSKKTVRECFPKILEKLRTMPKITLSHKNVMAIKCTQL